MRIFFSNIDAAFQSGFETSEKIDPTFTAVEVQVHLCLFCFWDVVLSEVNMGELPKRHHIDADHQKVCETKRQALPRAIYF